MSDEICASCRRPKAALSCELCFGPVCKGCVQRLAEDAFSFRKEVPDELKHILYCQACYDSTIAPELETYAEIMERAKQVFFFYDTQRARLPILAKSKEVFKVDDQLDRDETVLRLAFFAAAQGFNAIIEAVVVCEKVRNHGYQHSVWKGRGMAAKVDQLKLERDFE